MWGPWGAHVFISSMTALMRQRGTPGGGRQNDGESNPNGWLEHDETARRNCRVTERFPKREQAHGSLKTEARSRMQAAAFVTQND
jgi:hypothetical protein